MFIYVCFCFYLGVFFNLCFHFYVCFFTSTTHHASPQSTLVTNARLTRHTKDTQLHCSMHNATGERWVVSMVGGKVVMVYEYWKSGKCY